jgi:signal transduction histidine kinase
MVFAGHGAMARTINPRWRDEILGGHWRRCILRTMAQWVSVRSAWRGLRLPPFVVDTALGLVVTGFLELTEAGERRANHEHVPDVALLMLLGLVPAIAVRRRFPGTALALTTAIQAGLWATGTAPGPNVLAQLIAPYSTAAYAGRRTRIGYGIAAGAVLAALAVPGSWASAHVRGNVFGYLVLGGLAWLLGAVMRKRREGVARLADRAKRLEREQDLLARQAVATERLRIARELHDVVAHNLSVVVVQAQALHPVVGRDPEQARALAVSIEETGREALEEMRQLLGVLRADSPDDSDLGPQPGLDRLGALVEQVRQAGLPITLTVTGSPERLPAAVQLSAYRIVQEALTNVLKHAGPASASVTVSATDSGLELTISDDGRGAAASLGRPGVPGAGHGLLGMRERVTLFGGELSAGPRPGGGYEVKVVFPA